MEEYVKAWRWWCVSLIPALGKQRQVDLCEFEASLVYRASSRTVRAVTQRNPVSENKQKQNPKILIVLFIGVTFPMP